MPILIDAAIRMPRSRKSGLQTLEDHYLEFIIYYESVIKKTHHYRIATEWTGNTGTGTVNYRSYERSVTIRVAKKKDILCTSDTAFNSDASKHNPEELLLASISSCHLLWYLHLCSEAGVVVLSYTDNAAATMAENKDGGGHFTGAILHPVVLVENASMIDKAKVLHTEANRLCYIANSCNFPIRHEAEVRSDDVAHL